MLLKADMYRFQSPHLSARVNARRIDRSVYCLQKVKVGLFSLALSNCKEILKLPNF